MPGKTGTERLLYEKRLKSYIVSFSVLALVGFCIFLRMDSIRISNEVQSSQITVDQVKRYQQQRKNLYILNMVRYYTGMNFSNKAKVIKHYYTAEDASDESKILG